MQPMTPQRVLGRLRISVTSDESTSIERQREIITAWAEANNHTIAGWATDQGVSGAIDPFTTPQLGDWLNHRADQFDILACWKLDRISRSAIRLNKVIGWCIEHNKTLVSCSESIDISTPVGRLIANVIGFLAEGELDAMRERQKASRRKLREIARWPGGKPPYGYRVQPAPGGGKTLDIDPLAHRVVRRIVDELLDGKPLSHICTDLNRDGVVSPADHHRVCEQGEDADTGSPWRTWPLKHMLLSPTLVGHTHLAGVTVRDEQGDPIQMAEQPLVTPEERELIAAELAAAEGAPRERGNPAALIGIISCWFCETPLTSSRQTKALASGDIRAYSYYRCPNNCTPLIPTESAEAQVEKLILDAFGDAHITQKVWIPGDNTETALKAATTAFDELSATAANLTSKTAKDRLQRQLEALDARMAELEAKTTREGRYEHRPTDQTWREAWDTTTDRRALLKRLGVDIRIGITENGHLLCHPIELGTGIPGG